jgi:hypothetical protein
MQCMSVWERKGVHLEDKGQQANHQDPFPRLNLDHVAAKSASHFAQHSFAHRRWQLWWRSHSDTRSARAHVMKTSVFLSPDGAEHSPPSGSCSEKSKIITFSSIKTVKNNQNASKM